MEITALRQSQTPGAPGQLRLVVRGGWPLSSVLRAQRTLGQTVPLPVAVHIARSVCAVLGPASGLRARAPGGQRAHAAVCPRNVMIYEDGTVGLRRADEGPARSASDSNEPRADVVAIAGLLLTMRTGEETLTPTGHEALDALLALALEGSEADRFSSAAALKVALDRLHVPSLTRQAVQQFTADLRSAVRGAAAAATSAPSAAAAAAAVIVPPWAQRGVRMATLRRRAGRTLASCACVLMLLVAATQLRGPTATRIWTQTTRVATEAAATSRIVLAWLLPLGRARGLELAARGARSIIRFAHRLTGEADQGE